MIDLTIIVAIFAVVWTIIQIGDRLWWPRQHENDDVIGGHVREVLIRLVDAQAHMMESVAAMSSEMKASQELSRVRHDEIIRYLTVITDRVGS